MVTNATDRCDGRRTLATRDSERGALLLIAAMTMLAILAVAALVVDIGFGMWVRSDLQNAADAGALSGVHQLARIYDRYDHKRYDQYKLTADEKAEVVAAVNRVTQLNKAGGVAIAVPAADIQLGRLNPTTREFEQTDRGATAVRVVTRRDDTANEAVTTLVRSVVRELPLRTSAAAGISPVRRIPPGALHFPVAISKSWFNNAHHCDTNNNLKLFPPEILTGCAGLHVYDDSLLQTVERALDIIDETTDAVSDADLSDLEIDLFGPSPEVIAGETNFFFVGLLTAPVLWKVKELYDTLKDLDGRWKVLVPVFEDKPLDCIIPPIGQRKIVGITAAYVTGIFSSGGLLGINLKLDADVACDIVPFGEGGGPDYGVLVGKPRFIE